MDEISQLQQQIIDLEIRLALQDELLQTLNDTVVRLSQTLELQQAQLRLLYQNNKAHHADMLDSTPRSLLDEIPPHY